MLKLGTGPRSFIFGNTVFVSNFLLRLLGLLSQLRSRIQPQVRKFCLCMSFIIRVRRFCTWYSTGQEILPLFCSTIAPGLSLVLKPFSLIWNYGDDIPNLLASCSYTYRHKVLTYTEHHSVCPLVGIGTPPTPLPQASVPSLPYQRVGGGTPACT